MPGNAVGRHLVGAEGEPCRHIRHAHAMGPEISALIVKKPVVDGEDMPIRIDRRPHEVPLLARMVRRQQVLAPVLDPADRTAQPQRGNAQKKIVRIQLPPDAETAADIAAEQVHLRAVKPQGFGDQIAIGMRAFGRAVEFENAGFRIDPRKPAPAFERHAAMPSDPQVQFDHLRRIGKCRIDIAIALLDDRRFAVMARQKFDGVSGRIRDRRKFVDINEHQIGSILRRVRILGKDDSDRFADIPHPLPRHDRLLVGVEPRVLRRAEIDQRDIGPVHCLGGRSIDIGDDPMCHVRPDNAHVQRVGKSPVRRKGSCTGKQRGVLQPQDTFANLSALQTGAFRRAHLHASIVHRAMPRSARSAR